MDGLSYDERFTRRAFRVTVIAKAGSTLHKFVVGHVIDVQMCVKRQLELVIEDTEVLLVDRNLFLVEQKVVAEVHNVYLREREDERERERA